MRTLDAALHLARRFTGGVAAVATMLPSLDTRSPHKTADTLRHELTGDGHYKLGLEDAELITMRAIEARVRDPLAILNAMASNCGAMVIQLPQLHDADDVTIAGLAEMARESAEFMTSVAEAVADNKVSDNELARVDKELGEVIGRMQALRTRLAQMNAQPQRPPPAN